MTMRTLCSQRRGARQRGAEAGAGARARAPRGRAWGTARGGAVEGKEAAVVARQRSCAARGVGWQAGEGSPGGPFSLSSRLPTAALGTLYSSTSSCIHSHMDSCLDLLVCLCICVCAVRSLEVLLRGLSLRADGHRTILLSSRACTPPTLLCINASRLWVMGRLSAPCPSRDGEGACTHGGYGTRSHFPLSRGGVKLGHNLNYKRKSQGSRRRVTIRASHVAHLL
jgi:hypothetical protein